MNFKTSSTHTEKNIKQTQKLEHNASLQRETYTQHAMPAESRNKCDKRITADSLIFPYST